MNLLFIGSSSSICKKIQPYLKKEIYSISTKNKKIRNHFYIKKYSSDNLFKITDEHYGKVSSFHIPTSVDGSEYPQSIPNPKNLLDGGKSI